MKIIIPLLVGILSIMIISGCVSQLSPSDIAKTTNTVKKFLKDYPNAKITASSLDESYIETIIDDLRETCGEQMKVSAYWRVYVEDPDTRANVTIWIEEKNMKAVCVVKRGRV